MAEILYERGESDERPWGRWEVIDVGEGHIVKRISVKPGGQLSLQLHHHRAEHWIVVAGTAKVTVGDSIQDLGPDSHVFIPLETKHRVENPGEELMEFIEIQAGDRLDENDIVRFEDIYGRS